MCTKPGIHNDHIKLVYWFINEFVCDWITYMYATCNLSVSFVFVTKFLYLMRRVNSPNREVSGIPKDVHYLPMECANGAYQGAIICSGWFWYS